MNIKRAFCHRERREQGKNQVDTYNLKFPSALPGFGLLSTTVFVMMFGSSVIAAERTLPADCTYETATWNVNQKTSVNRKSVRHPYSALSADEVDPVTGCTVCIEDQEAIKVPSLPEFSVCFKLAPLVRFVLSGLVTNGAPIRTIIGYRVIKSRGQLDHDGNRTQFSNHSFGTAIDINPEQNGLYDNCVSFGPECRLVRGGEWRPGVPGTLEKNGDIVKTLNEAGFMWGGEIDGKQKDFMHFSLTGY